MNTWLSLIFVVKNVFTFFLVFPDMIHFFFVKNAQNFWEFYLRLKYMNICIVEHFGPYFSSHGDFNKWIIYPWSGVYKIANNNYSAPRIIRCFVKKASKLGG